MAVNAGIRLVDEMTAPINHILDAMNTMIGEMETISRIGESSFNSSAIVEMRSHIETAQIEMQELAKSTTNTGARIKEDTAEQSKFNDEITKGAGQAETLFDKFKTGLAAIGAAAGVREVMDFVHGSMDLFDTQLNAENQLAAVLANTLESNVGNAFDKIKAKASEIQGRGIYGDEAMIAGAGELATYFTDTDAITSMMDTLANYTMGMTGGGEVGTEAMVNYATNLGKIMTGAYDAMTKKGFEFTDAQKAIIEGSATEAQYIQELGSDYVNMSEDMRAASVINNIIEESWAGLYDTMSNTPQGAIIQMKNAFGDLREEVGRRVYPSIVNVAETIMNNAPQIEEIVLGFADKLSVVIDKLSYIVSGASEVAAFFQENWTTIEPIIMGIVFAMIAYNAALKTYTAISALSAAAAGIYGAALAMQEGLTFSAAAAQYGFNAALLACPITWLLLALGALAVGFVVLSKKVGGSWNALLIMRDTYMSCFEDILLFFAEAGVEIQNTCDKWSMAFFTLAKEITTYMTYSKVGVLGQIDEMVTNTAKAINWLIDKVNGATGLSISKLAETGLGFIQDTISEKLTIANEAFLEQKKEEIANRNDGLETIKKWVAANREARSNEIVNNMVKAFGEDDGTYNNPFSDLASSIEQPKELKLDNADDMNNAVNSIADNTSNISDKLDMTDEDLKLLRDMAEREAVNQFTTAEIKVDMGGVTNNLASDMDIDGFTDVFRARLEAAMLIAAEGVHT